MYTLTFNDQEMQILNAALVELPFKVVAPLVASINQQLEAARSADQKPQVAEKEK